MERKEFRVLVKHYFLRGKTIRQTIEKLEKYYGVSAPSIKMVRKWFAELRRASTSDSESFGTPDAVSTPQKNQEIPDRSLKVRESEETMKGHVLCRSIVSVVTNQLCMRKLYGRWVPRSVAVYYKHLRVQASKKCLSFFNCNPKEFLSRLVIVADTWIYYHTLKSLQQSKEYIIPCETAPKNDKVCLSANKFMATVFWDARGIIHTDYLQTGETMSSEYYAIVLDRFRDDLKKKRPHMANKTVLLHQDNKKVYVCSVVEKRLNDICYEILPHPPCSPDLAASDFFLFPILKKWLYGKRFASHDEIVAQMNEFFERLSKYYYLRGIENLLKHWARCIELEGDYVKRKYIFRDLKIDLHSQMTNS